MWAYSHNSSRYLSASPATQDPGTMLPGSTSVHAIEEPTNDSVDSESGTEDETEPALQFLFNNRPKCSSTGFVLGSDDESCDVLLGELSDQINEQMVVFTFNEYHELVMNVTANIETSVCYQGHKKATRRRFSWIFPHNHSTTRVKVGRVLEFDIVLPSYCVNKNIYRQNCASFLISAAATSLSANSHNTKGIEVNEETSRPSDPFYLRGEELGNGSYGSVYKVRRMPDGMTFAGKEFFNKRSFDQEVKMLRKVCETPNVSTNKYLVNWDISDGVIRNI